MDDAEKLVSVPEELIFKSYLQRTIDHLRLIYDPVYGPEILDPYSTPEYFKDGVNILEYAENLMPKLGQAKNLDYLPFLVYFSGYGRDYYGTIRNFVFPENGPYVTPDNMNIAASRFPELHGGNGYGDITENPDPYKLADFMYPLNLTGDILFTYGKYYVAKGFDRILDSCNVILHESVPFPLRNKPDFYKTTDIYSVWNLKTMYDGTVLKEKDSKVYDDCTSGINGEFGWKNGKLPGEIIEEKLKFRLEIHSVSPFRYKYVVVCFTRALQGDYKQCPYDFVKNGYSVLYESPDWCTGDSVFEYEFQMNGPKPEEQTYIYVTSPRVIIYPEYPDRLAEIKREIGII